METIRIKCPHCGALLTVADSPDNAGKSVRCPVCKEKNAFSAFRPVKPQNADADKTSLGIPMPSEDQTQLPQNGVENTIGYLFDKDRRKRYRLMPGVNLIGRKTRQSVSPATVPIETDDLGFSRQHLYIEVVHGPDGIIRHYAYNALNKNETHICGVRLESGDKIILHDADEIRSAKTVLVFKLTEFETP